MPIGIITRSPSIWRASSGEGGVTPEDRSNILAYSMIMGNIKMGLLIYNKDISVDSDEVGYGFVANIKL